MNDKQIIDIARIKLPLVLEAFTKANLEAQKTMPNLDVLTDLLRVDEIDGFYDVADLLGARATTAKILGKNKELEGETHGRD